MSIRDVHPGLAPASLNIELQELAMPYSDYTAHVSPNSMAISHQTAAFVLWLCKQTRPGRVCDFGTGFTSYVLRHYGYHTGIEVVSVDDAPAWLRWSHRFLTRYGLSDESAPDRFRLMSWGEYSRTDLTHDLIVYDFSCGDVREDNFGMALDRLTVPGIAVFDDAQNSSHQSRMSEECSARHLDLLDVGEWTRDQYGRFAAVAVKGAWSR